MIVILMFGHVMSFVVSFCMCEYSLKEREMYCLVNPRRACAARVTVLGLSVCHFSRTCVILMRIPAHALSAEGLHFSAFHIFPVASYIMNMF